MNNNLFYLFEKGTLIKSKHYKLRNKTSGYLFSTSFSLMVSLQPSWLSLGLKLKVFLCFFRNMQLNTFLIISIWYPFDFLFTFIGGKNIRSTKLFFLWIPGSSKLHYQMMSEETYDFIRHSRNIRLTKLFFLWIPGS